MIRSCRFIALLTLACSPGLDFSGSNFQCVDQTACPPGFICVATHCVPRFDGGGGDGGIDANPLLCGNGALDPGEECDDMDDDDTDGCVGGCRLARCGDSHIRTGVEECDDGNANAGDLCNPTCRECLSGAAHFTWTGNGACYTRYDMAGIAWDAANAQCAVNGNGASLAVFETQAERNAVEGAIGGGGELWVGLTDLASEGDWSWISGTTLAYPGWQAGEPGGGMAENCAVARTVGFADYPCNTTVIGGYLCEDDAWVIGPRGEAYRLVYYETDYAIANGACTAAGVAHLVVIESAEENDFIASHLRREMLIGADDQALEGTFAWKTDAPFAYNAWGGGAPDDQDGTEDCVVIRPDGTWDDVPCDEPRTFICEVDP